MTDELRIEATGETIGEAKWTALRELERLAPGLDRAAVRFEVLSEGERGLLGVGYLPARVAAIADAAIAKPPDTRDESPAAALVRDLLARVTAVLGVDCRIEVREDETTLEATLSDHDLGVVIGRHGQTIDALEVLANAIVSRRLPDAGKRVVVDAEGYRGRREAVLSRLAASAAEQALATREEVALEPMSAAERKVVHTQLAEDSRVETASEGAEPRRYVVVRAVRTDPSDEAPSED